MASLPVISISKLRDNDPVEAAKLLKDGTLWSQWSVCPQVVRDIVLTSSARHGVDR